MEKTDNMEKGIKMEKQTSGIGITQETVIIDQSPEMIAELKTIMEMTGFFSAIPVEYDIQGYLSNIIRGVLEVLHVETGRISLLVRVKPVVATEVIVEASIVRRERNVTVVSVEEFRMKESDKMVYTSRATFYNMPLASL
ncbi:hypothetical protein POM88_011136 [Heracleum sosnowskyi]|uniref:Thioesterase domain-containing protein n=1 Tax=Heracleum sosnowskyi TaxID=360622 RepID=A0AAD8IXU0_9APIA|nr:hypothetical protein POM88_011136 [Heracleum sosnowskyi]